MVARSVSQDARRFSEVLPKRFEKYSLQLHPEKTRLLRFSKPKDDAKASIFDFLGFTHYWGKSRRGQRVVQRKTAKDRLKRSVRRVYRWCEEYRHTPTKEQWKTLCRKVQGHYAYFGITGNYRTLAGYLLQVKRSWHKWLSRRSRGNQIPWELFTKLLEHYPLPNPRIVHQYAGANP
jgi:RNA-directed DNA polymerase